MEATILPSDVEQPSDKMSFGAEVRLRLLGVLAGVVLLNLVWFVLYLVSGGGQGDLRWPSQGHVWSEMWLLTFDGFQGTTLLRHSVATLSRVLSAMAAALVIGGGIGVALGSRKQLRHLFDPLLSFLRVFSPAAVIPVLYTFLGIQRPVIGFTAGFVATWLVADRVARVLASGPTRERLIEELVQIVRVALLVTWLVVAFGELIGTGVGLGSAIWTARTFFRMGMVTGVGVWSALLIATMDYGVRLLGRFLINRDR